MIFWLLISTLLFLAWEDWQYRSVAIWSLALYGILVVVWLWPQFDFYSALLNLCFLLIQFLLLYLYFRFRDGSGVKLAGTMLGWGDIVFIAINAILFPSFQFLSGYMVGLVATLAVALLAGLHRNKARSIPLISGLALSQGLVLVGMRFNLF